MIGRYTRPAMGHIWEPENKFAIWKEIELLACEAQAELGQCGITLQDCAGVTACTAAADGEEGGQAPAGEEAGPSALLSERIDATPRTLQVPEVGYLLAKNYWHHGYATESARACMEFAFDVLGVPEVFSCIRDDNTPSLAVARRNGMELCGRFSKHYYGQDMEHLLYVARKESWGL